MNGCKTVCRAYSQKYCYNNANVYNLAVDLNCLFEMTEKADG